MRRQVAKEEAMATGAYFGKSLIQIGVDFEDKQFMRWTSWAEQRSKILEQRRAAGHSASTDDLIDSTSEPEPEAELENEVQEAETL